MRPAYRHIINRQLMKRHRVRQNHLNAWLTFLDQQIEKYPEMIVPADEEQLKRIAAMVEGVEV